VFQNAIIEELTALNEVVARKKQRKLKKAKP
jgi:hypothetical protein